MFARASALRKFRFALFLTLLVPRLPAAAAPTDEPADRKAAETLSQMTDAEKVELTVGLSPEPPVPQGAGYIPGISHLRIPSLIETDAELGVSYAGGIRNDGATGLPSNMALAATWDPALAEAAGAMIGSEARSKGFNVMLAGAVNLVRDPRGGRTFEYLGEDPLLSGIMAGASVAGIQSNHVISTLKHFALNAQETGRTFANGIITDGALRESDLLAFQIAIERGGPGAVMCAYNRVNGARACGADYLLNKVLKRDWRFKGWVMSDWGAVGGVDYALKGLDQQSGAEFDARVYFGSDLLAKSKSDQRYAKRLNDMNRRILRSIYAVGVDTHPAKVTPIDFADHAKVAEQVERAGIVLLRNRGDILPLARSVKRIAVIGGYADSGVMSGGGSSQSYGEGGPAIRIPLGGDSPFNAEVFEGYHRSVPVKAIKARAPVADVRYRNGRYITDAVSIAKQSDVAIVFATQWTSEGFDVPDLNLPNGQDALIAAVADANPNTLVVLETGGPVLMPWLDKTAAVLEAWYPGSQGAEAIAAVLFGEANPSGRLPVTFPANVAQLPRPILPGADVIEPEILPKAKPGQRLDIDYNIEGSDVGYRWFARKNETPLFAFGYGMSYTRFVHGVLTLHEGRQLTARFSIRNVGPRMGADIAQVYLVSTPAGATKRLVAFQRVDVSPGEERPVEIPIDPRLLAKWKDGKWELAGGIYGFALGRSADDIDSVVRIHLPRSRWSEMKTIRLD